MWFTGTDVREIWSCQYGSFDNWMYIGRYYYIYSHKYRAYYIGRSCTRLICFVLLGQGMITYLAFGLRDDFYQLVEKKAYVHTAKQFYTT